MHWPLTGAESMCLWSRGWSDKAAGGGGEESVVPDTNPAGHAVTSPACVSCLKGKWESTYQHLQVQAQKKASWQEANESMTQPNSCWESWKGLCVPAPQSPWAPTCCQERPRSDYYRPQARETELFTLQNGYEAQGGSCSFHLCWPKAESNN